MACVRISVNGLFNIALRLRTFSQRFISSPSHESSSCAFFDQKFHILFTFQLRQRIGCHDNIIQNDHHFGVKKRLVRLCNWIRFLKVQENGDGNGDQLLPGNMRLVSSSSPFFEVTKDVEAGSQLVLEPFHHYQTNSCSNIQNAISLYILSK